MRTYKDLTRTRIMVVAGVMTGSEAVEADLGIASFVVGDGENVVGRYINADIVEPAVEAVAESVTQGDGSELEIAAVLKITL